MFIRIAGIAGRILAGIVLFYLALCLIIVPLIVPWAVRSQGSKLFKSTVLLRSVQLNPFLLRLSIYDFGILDKDKQRMAGFDKFWADISFISLLKKEIRVESVGLNGLFVNAVLLDGGRINLMDLVPQDGKKTVPAVSGKEPDKAGNSAGPDAAGDVRRKKTADNKPLPSVKVDSISLNGGKIEFTDKTLLPNFKTSLHGINIKITGLSTKPDCRIEAVFGAKLDEKGVIELQSMIDPFAQPLQCEMSFKLNDYALGVLTPYVGKYTGREVKDGKLDVRMEYRISDNRITASHKILVQKFDFGRKVESKDALNLPYGLALAILEDPQGRINISLPVKGDMSDPEFDYGRLVFQVVRNFFMKLVTQPFSFMASILGMESGTEELGMVRFAPGKSDIPQAEKEKLDVLVKSLSERPKLLLEVDGSYDPDMDWKAVKTGILNRDYDDLKKKSGRDDKWIYQELYQRRFGILSLWNVTKEMRISNRDFTDKDLETELKRRLIEDAPADLSVMAALASERAKNTYDYMISAGFDGKRIKVGENKQSQGSMGTVPLEFTLTVFEESGGGDKEDAAAQEEKTPAEEDKSQ